MRSLAGSRDTEMAVRLATFSAWLSGYSLITTGGQISQQESTTRPQARGFALHGGLPSWLEESDPAGVIFVHDELAVPSGFFVPYQLPAQL